MDTDSSSGEPASGNSESTELLALFGRISHGWRTLAQETMETEEMFLEFVKHIDVDVRPAWYNAETQAEQYRSDMARSERQRGKDAGLVKNIRQQLANEQSQRNVAESRVEKLEEILDTLRQMLSGKNGDRVLTDYEREQMERSTAEKIARLERHSSKVQHKMRKSEDFDVSFDEDSADDLDDFDEAMEGQSSERPAEQRSERRERVSETRRVITRTSRQGGEQSNFVSESSEGDIHIIAKTHVHIQENGPVLAHTRLSAKPRKSVGFTEPVSSMLNVRRSQSVPRIIDDTDGNRIRRSKEENDLLSSDGGSVAASSEMGDSVVGDFQVHHNLHDGAHASMTAASSNVLRRRSRSFGQDLDCRMHDFRRKFFTHAITCCVCKSNISLEYGKKCQECKRYCHTSCEVNAPIPCSPPIINPIGCKSGGTIFELEKCASAVRPRIPAVVSQCIRYIQKQGLNEEGLYRVCGSKTDIEKLKKQYYAAYRKNPQIASIPDLDRVRDVHVVCGFLTNFLMSLKEPLLTYALWSRFATASSSSTNNEFYRLMDQLPVPNRDTLASLMIHFWSIVDAPGSRWTANTLQKVLAPSLIGYSRPSGQLSPGELRGEYIRQQMIIGKLFEIRRDYWTGLRETEPRHSNTRYSGEGASMSQNNRVDSSFIEHYDAPDDSIMEGGASAKTTGNSSFSNMFRAFSGVVGSNSKTNLNDLKAKTGTIKPTPQFQSPLMSD